MTEQQQLGWPCVTWRGQDGRQRTRCLGALDQELALMKSKDFSGRGLEVVLILTVLGLCSGDKGDCKLR